MCRSKSVSGALRSGSDPWGVRGGRLTGPRRSVILLIDDGVFGVVELSAVSEAGPKI
ncbi:MAG TPA: hypothetical protein VNO35_28235 [Steroidobacteraceae bacterium]|nr:hypothetical protein [Steroidobacteraceae bacterium]